MGSLPRGAGLTRGAGLVEPAGADKVRNSYRITSARREQLDEGLVGRNVDTEVKYDGLAFLAKTLRHGYQLKTNLRNTAAKFLGILAVAIATVLFAAYSLGPFQTHVAGLPSCSGLDVSAPRAEYDEWANTPLDTRLTLSQDYVPPDLVPIGPRAPALKLRQFVVDDLLKLLNRAGTDGVALRVTSAYRSYRSQGALYAGLRSTFGDAYAADSAARPGHSEHQLGTTVDITGGDSWLETHAWQFGFASSYPDGQSPGLTCYKPEPWHYRYFGLQRAAAMRASGMSPREWLWQNEPWSVDR